MRPTQRLRLPERLALLQKGENRGGFYFVIRDDSGPLSAFFLVDFPCVSIAVPSRPKMRRIRSKQS